jgi:IclR family transcriptional regulator, acetate operon repressor
VSVQLDRAIDILELIHSSERPLALGEVADRIRIPKSAAHRILQDWSTRGYVEQEPGGQRYAPTLKLAIIGFRHLVASGLRDVCYPELRLLADETGELARLAIVNKATLTWIVEAQGARGGLRYDGNLGRQAVLHATAAGKAWLSTLSDEEAVRLVLEQGFRGPDETGPRAVRTVEEFLAMLNEARKLGFATSIEEAAIGVNSVAAPIVDDSGSGTAVGAIIVVGPSARMTTERIADIVPMLKDSAARISLLWPIRRHLANDIDDCEAL